MYLGNRRDLKGCDDDYFEMDDYDFHMKCVVWELELKAHDNPEELIDDMFGC